MIFVVWCKVLKMNFYRKSNQGHDLTDLVAPCNEITDHFAKGSAVVLTQVVENETFDTVSHRKFLWMIKKGKININR